MTTIESFDGENAFLSNFFPAPIVVDGKTFPTTEHFFQCMKCVSPEEREAIRNAHSPGKAKRMGAKVKMVGGWEGKRINVMLDALRFKFTQHPNLAADLLATGDAELIEGNNWGDKFWGVCDGVGKNWLGKLLMKVREELRQETRQ